MTTETYLDLTYEHAKGAKRPIRPKLLKLTDVTIPHRSRKKTKVKTKERSTTAVRERIYDDPAYTDDISHLANPLRRSSCSGKSGEHKSSGSSVFGVATSNALLGSTTGSSSLGKRSKLTKEFLQYANKQYKLRGGVGPGAAVNMHGSSSSKATNAAYERDLDTSSSEEHLELIKAGSMQRRGRSLERSLAEKSNEQQQHLQQQQQQLKKQKRSSKQKRNLSLDSNQGQQMQQDYDVHSMERSRGATSHKSRKNHAKHWQSDTNELLWQTAAVATENPHGLASEQEEIYSVLSSSKDSAVTLPVGAHAAAAAAVAASSSTKLQIGRRFLRGEIGIKSFNYYLLKEGLKSSKKFVEKQRNTLTVGLAGNNGNTSGSGGRSHSKKLHTRSEENIYEEIFFKDTKAAKGIIAAAASDEENKNSTKPHQQQQQQQQQHKKQQQKQLNFSAGKVELSGPSSNIDDVSSVGVVGGIYADCELCMQQCTKDNCEYCLSTQQQQQQQQQQDMQASGSQRGAGVKRVGGGGGSISSVGSQQQFRINQAQLANASNTNTLQQQQLQQQPQTTQQDNNKDLPHVANNPALPAAHILEFQSYNPNNPGVYKIETTPVAITGEYNPILQFQQSTTSSTSTATTTPSDQQQHTLLQQQHQQQYQQQQGHPSIHYHVPPQKPQQQLTQTAFLPLGNMTNHYAGAAGMLITQAATPQQTRVGGGGGGSGRNQPQHFIVSYQQNGAGGVGSVAGVRPSSMQRMNTKSSSSSDSLQYYHHHQQQQQQQLHKYNTMARLEASVFSANPTQADLYFTNFGNPATGLGGSGVSSAHPLMYAASRSIGGSQILVDPYEPPQMYKSDSKASILSEYSLRSSDNSQRYARYQHRYGGRYGGGQISDSSLGDSLFSSYQNSGQRRYFGSTESCRFGFDCRRCSLDGGVMGLAGSGPNIGGSNGMATSMGAGAEKCSYSDTCRYECRNCDCSSSYFSSDFDDMYGTVSGTGGSGIPRKTAAGTLPSSTQPGDYEEQQQQQQQQLDLKQNKYAQDFFKHVNDVKRSIYQSEMQRNNSLESGRRTHASNKIAVRGSKESPKHMAITQEPVITTLPLAKGRINNKPILMDVAPSGMTKPTPAPRMSLQQSAGIMPLETRANNIVDQPKASQRKPQSNERREYPSLDRLVASTTGAIPKSVGHRNPEKQLSEETRESYDSPKSMLNTGESNEVSQTSATSRREKERIRYLNVSGNSATNGQQTQSKRHHHHRSSSSKSIAGGGPGNGSSNSACGPLTRRKDVPAPPPPSPATYSDLQELKANMEGLQDDTKSRSLESETSETTTTRTTTTPSSSSSMAQTTKMEVEVKKDNTKVAAETKATNESTVTVTNNNSNNDSPGTVIKSLATLSTTTSNSNSETAAAGVAATGNVSNSSTTNDNGTNFETEDDDEVFYDARSEDSAGTVASAASSGVVLTESQAVAGGAGGSRSSTSNNRRQQLEKLQQQRKDARQLSIKQDEGYSMQKQAVASKDDNERCVKDKMTLTTDEDQQQQQQKMNEKNQQNINNKKFNPAATTTTNTTTIMTPINGNGDDDDDDGANQKKLSPPLETTAPTQAAPTITTTTQSTSTTTTTSKVKLAEYAKQNKNEMQIQITKQKKRKENDHQQQQKQQQQEIKSDVSKESCETCCLAEPASNDRQQESKATATPTTTCADKTKQNMKIIKTNHKSEKAIKTKDENITSKTTTTTMINNKSCALPAIDKVASNNVAKQDAAAATFKEKQQSPTMLQNNSPISTTTSTTSTTTINNMNTTTTNNTNANQNNDVVTVGGAGEKTAADVIDAGAAGILAKPFEAVAASVANSFVSCESDIALDASSTAHSTLPTTVTTTTTTIITTAATNNNNNSSDNNNKRPSLQRQDYSCLDSSEAQSDDSHLTRDSITRESQNDELSSSAHDKIDVSTLPLPALPTKKRRTRSRASSSTHQYQQQQQHHQPQQQQQHHSHRQQRDESNEKYSHHHHYPNKDKQQKLHQQQQQQQKAIKDTGGKLSPQKANSQSGELSAFQLYVAKRRESLEASTRSFNEKLEARRMHYHMGGSGGGSSSNTGAGSGGGGGHMPTYLFGEHYGIRHGGGGRKLAVPPSTSPSNKEEIYLNKSGWVQVNTKRHGNNNDENRGYRRGYVQQQQPIQQQNGATHMDNGQRNTIRVIQIDNTRRPEMMTTRQALLQHQHTIPTDNVYATPKFVGSKVEELIQRNEARLMGGGGASRDPTLRPGYRILDPQLASILNERPGFLPVKSLNELESPPPITPILSPPPAFQDNSAKASRSFERQRKPMPGRQQTLQQDHLQHTQPSISLSMHTNGGPGNNKGMVFSRSFEYDTRRPTPTDSYVETFSRSFDGNLSERPPLPPLHANVHHGGSSSVGRIIAPRDRSPNFSSLTGNSPNYLSKRDGVNTGIGGGGSSGSLRSRDNSPKYLQPQTTAYLNTSIKEAPPSYSNSAQAASTKYSPRARHERSFERSKSHNVLGRSRKSQFNRSGSSAGPPPSTAMSRFRSFDTTISQRLNSCDSGARSDLSNDELDNDDDDDCGSTEFLNTTNYHHTLTTAAVTPTTVVSPFKTQKQRSLTPDRNESHSSSSSLRKQRSLTPESRSLTPEERRKKGSQASLMGSRQNSSSRSNTLERKHRLEDKGPSNISRSSSSSSYSGGEATHEGSGGGGTQHRRSLGRSAKQAEEHRIRRSRSLQLTERSPNRGHKSIVCVGQTQASHNAATPIYQQSNMRSNNAVSNFPPTIRTTGKQQSVVVQPTTNGGSSGCNRSTTRNSDIDKSRSFEFDYNNYNRNANISNPVANSGQSRSHSGSGADSGSNQNVSILPLRLDFDKSRSFDDDYRTEVLSNSNNNTLSSGSMRYLQATTSGNNTITSGDGNNGGGHHMGGSTRLRKSSPVAAERNTRSPQSSGSSTNNLHLPPRQSTSPQNYGTRLCDHELTYDMLRKSLDRSPIMDFRRGDSSDYELPPSMLRNRETINSGGNSELNFMSNETRIYEHPTTVLKPQRSLRHTQSPSEQYADRLERLQSAASRDDIALDVGVSGDYIYRQPQRESRNGSGGNRSSRKNIILNDKFNDENCSFWPRCGACTATDKKTPQLNDNKTSHSKTIDTKNTNSTPNKNQIRRQNSLNDDLNDVNSLRDLRSSSSSLRRKRKPTTTTTLSNTTMEKKQNNSGGGGIEKCENDILKAKTKPTNDDHHHLKNQEHITKEEDCINVNIINLDMSKQKTKKNDDNVAAPKATTQWTLLASGGTSTTLTGIVKPATPLKSRPPLKPNAKQLLTRSSSIKRNVAAATTASAAKTIKLPPSPLTSSLTKMRRHGKHNDDACLTATVKPRVIPLAATSLVFLGDIGHEMPITRTRDSTTTSTATCQLDTNYRNSSVGVAIDEYDENKEERKSSVRTITTSNNQNFNGNKWHTQQQQQQQQQRLYNVDTKTTRITSASAATNNSNSNMVDTNGKRKQQQENQQPQKHDIEHQEVEQRRSISMPNILNNNNEKGFPRSTTSGRGSTPGVTTTTTTTNDGVSVIGIRSCYPMHLSQQMRAVSSPSLSDIASQQPQQQQQEQKDCNNDKKAPLATADDATSLTATTKTTATVNPIYNTSNQSNNKNQSVGVLQKFKRTLTNFNKNPNQLQINGGGGGGGGQQRQAFLQQQQTTSQATKDSKQSPATPPTVTLIGAATVNDSSNGGGGAGSGGEDGGSSGGAISTGAGDGNSGKYRFGPLIWRSSKERRKTKFNRRDKCNSGDSGIQIELENDEQYNRTLGDASNRNSGVTASAGSNVGASNAIRRTNSAKASSIMEQSSSSVGGGGGGSNGGHEGGNSANNVTPLSAKAKVLRKIDLLERKAPESLPTRSLSQPNGLETFGMRSSDLLEDSDSDSVASHDEAASSSTYYPIYAEVLYNFTAAGPQELGLERGTLIEILRKEVGPWWFGRIKKEEASLVEEILDPELGWFPKEFVRIIQCPEVDPFYVAQMLPRKQMSSELPPAVDGSMASVPVPVADFNNKSEAADSSMTVDQSNITTIVIESPTSTAVVAPQNFMDEGDNGDMPMTLLNSRMNVMLDTADVLRRSAIRELLETEVNYVKLLSAICEGYLPAMSKRIDIFSPNSIRLIFSNIAAIYKFQKKFLEALRKGIEQNQISKVFLKMHKGFLCYSTYCNAYPRALIELESYDRIKDARIILENCRESENLAELPLSAHLLAPVQRICRYPLHLAEIIKTAKNANKSNTTIKNGGECGEVMSPLTTKPNEPIDYEQLDVSQIDIPDTPETVTLALDAMKGITEAVNEGKRHSETIARHQASFQNFKGPPLHLHSTRFFLQIDATRQKQNLWNSSYTLFLFDNQLVYCKRDIIKRNHFVYKGRIFLDRCRVVNVRDGKMFGHTIKNSLRIYCESRDKWYDFSFRSANRKHRFLSTLALERQFGGKALYVSEMTGFEYNYEERDCSDQSDYEMPESEHGLGHTLRLRDYDGATTSASGESSVPESPAKSGYRFSDTLPKKSQSRDGIASVDAATAQQLQQQHQQQQQQTGSLGRRRLGNWFRKPKSTNCTPSHSPTHKSGAAGGGDDIADVTLTEIAVAAEALETAAAAITVNSLITME